LGEACAGAGDHQGALQAYRRAAALDGRHRGALLKVSTLAAEEAPEEAVAAHRALLEMDELDPQSIHALFGLCTRLGRGEQAFCAAAALVGLGFASEGERLIHEAEMQKPLPAELPRLADGALDRAPILAAGDEGPARELLAL